MKNTTPTRAELAAMFGRMGGQATTDKKKRAAKRNGRKGGRPKKRR